MRGTRAGRPDSGYTIDQHPGLAVVADGSVVLFSGNGANITRTLPEIAAALPNAVRPAGRAAAGIVCKRLDTAVGKDAAAEAQPIRDW